MTWAMEQQLVLDPHACSVLTALANHADRDGTGSFPSVETLQRYTKLSERTIRAKLATLEQSGIIRRGNQAIAAAHIARADKRPVVWDLAMELGVQPSHPVAVSGVQEPHPGKGAGCSSRTDGVQLTTERGATAAPEPSFNQQRTDLPTSGACEDVGADRVGTFEGHTSAGAPQAAPTEVVRIAVELRRRGYAVTSMDPALRDAVAEGVTFAQLFELAGIHPPNPEFSNSATYLLRVARRQRAEASNPTHVPRGTHERSSSTRSSESAVDRAARRAREIAARTGIGR